MPGRPRSVRTFFQNRNQQLKRKADGHGTRLSAYLRNRNHAGDGAQVILEALLKTFGKTPYESVDPSVGIFPAKSL